MKTLAYIYFDELGSHIIRCEETRKEKDNNKNNKKVENILLAIAGIMIVIICIIF